MLSLNIGNDYNRRPLILAPLMMDPCPSFFQEDVEDSVLKEFFQVDLSYAVCNNFMMRYTNNLYLIFLTKFQ